MFILLKCTTKQKNMRITLIVLIGIHGIIHLFGFFKAFGISQFNAISHPIPKTHGVFWLLAFVLFATTAILFFVYSDYWWLSGFLALIISQVLIFSYWSDAKYGTIANLIILLVTIIGFSSFNFKNRINEERLRLFENSKITKHKNLTEDAIIDLPPIVQKWLRNSGVVGKQLVNRVYLGQELQLKMKPEQTDWNSGTAEQYFTVQPPAFSWSINTEINSVLSILGRDKFEDGKGEMMIKLLSLIPVASAKNHEKVNQATLQRYLAEIVWFPSASLSEYIKWETLDDYSARATMEYMGTEGSGVFYFDKNGNFQKFIALRYQDSNAIKPTEWAVIATKIEERNGIKIPVECEASWKLESGNWTWLKLKVTDIQHDVEKIRDVR